MTRQGMLPCGVSFFATKIRISLQNRKYLTFWSLAHIDSNYEKNGMSKNLVGLFLLNNCNKKQFSFCRGDNDGPHPIKRNTIFIVYICRECSTNITLIPLRGKYIEYSVMKSYVFHNRHVGSFGVCCKLNCNSMQEKDDRTVML